MKLSLLGTAGYHPNDQRHTSCAMLAEIGLLFDAGTGFYRVPARLQTDQVQIVLSHPHLDHVCGLTFFLPTLLSGIVKSAQVYGDRHTLETVCDHLFASALFPVLPSFEFVEIPETLDVGQGGRMTHIPLAHPGGSRGYRVDWPNRSLAIITDTTCDGSYAEFVRGVDVLVHECNFRDGEEGLANLTGHSTLTPVLELARAAQVGRLILTHVDPTLTGDDPLGLAEKTSPVPTIVAEDLMEFDF